MKIAGVSILPEVEPSQMPFWRQVLRGISGCTFQANELTALFVVAAATYFSWRLGAALVVSVLSGTIAARLLRPNTEMLGLGLYGWNSGIMGLAFVTFFQPSLAFWLWVVALGALVAAVNVAMVRWVPFPTLGAPFTFVFWALWPIAEIMGLEKIDLGTFPDAPVQFVPATIAGIGAMIFAGSTIVGLIVLAGLLVSNWRHAVVALMGSALAASLATHVGRPGAAINSGFVAFNAVLAALAAYVLISNDLRMAALAALGATWIFSFLNRLELAPALASGQLFVVWLILLVGWFNARFNGAGPQSKAEAKP